MEICARRVVRSAHAYVKQRPRFRWQHFRPHLLPALCRGMRAATAVYTVPGNLWQHLLLPIWRQHCPQHGMGQYCLVEGFFQTRQIKFSLWLMNFQIAVRGNSPQGKNRLTPQPVSPLHIRERKGLPVDDAFRLLLHRASSALLHQPNPASQGCIFQHIRKLDANASFFEHNRQAHHHERTHAKLYEGIFVSYQFRGAIKNFRNPAAQAEAR